MKETRTFTGRIVRKHKTIFGKYILTFSDIKHTVKAECGEALYNSLCEGIHLTIVLYGNQLVSYKASADNRISAATSITETSAYQHGKPLYYRSSRCTNASDFPGFTQRLPHVNELVSFDADLFEHLPVQHSEIDVPCPDGQYLAVIVEPKAKPSTEIAQDTRFTFCGYDLIDEQTQLSAIVHYSAAFSKVIHDEHLNSFGLFCSYTDAKHTQKALRSIYPNEKHADCVIVELWRYICE